MSGGKGQGQRENKHDSFRMRFSPDTYFIGTAAENITEKEHENVGTLEEAQGKDSTEVRAHSTLRN